jgi:hypothetical protein
MYTLIQTAKLNNVDPQAWLAAALTRIADIPQAPLGEFLVIATTSAVIGWQVVVVSCNM